MKRLMAVLVLCLMTGGVARGQEKTYAPGTLTPVLRANLPSPGDANRIWSVTDCADATCATGGGSTNVKMTWNGSAYSVVGGGSGTVTSVSASGGTETTTGSAITSTGTIRSSQSVRTSALDPVSIADSDRGGLLIATTGGAEVDIAQAGTAGNFPAKWYADVKCTGAGGCVITPTTSTIDGAATKALAQNQTVRIVSDGTNYVTTLGGGAAGITDSAPSGKVTSSADGSGNLHEAVVGDTLAGAVIPKVYIALLTQSGTDAPVATVLTNSLGGTVVWDYSTVGTYTATLAGAFTSGKTLIFTGASNTAAEFDGNCLAVNAKRTDNNVVTFYVQAFALGMFQYQDGDLLNTEVQILVYP